MDSTINLSREQDFFISSALHHENILVDACIGSGKTTAIQHLCNALPNDVSILYLTYNRLLKLDAQSKINNKNATVTNYHGFAYQSIPYPKPGMPQLLQAFNGRMPPIRHYDVLIIDEYQDITQEIADMLLYIKSTNENMQIIAVGDMAQKIYDTTTLDVMAFIHEFLGDYTQLEFTQCFRLQQAHAEMLGRIWRKKIVGVNESCKIEVMDMVEIIGFLSRHDPKDILCLGAKKGLMAKTLNTLESTYSAKFNKKTVYASIQERDANIDPGPTNAIFTTFDSSKGLERKICVVFDFDETYWQIRVSMPNCRYEILRNIFCVAASRGKERIIFVDNDNKLLSENTLSTNVNEQMDFSDVDISDMFDFKYREDINECFSLLETRLLSDAKSAPEININRVDELIDLSPCIGVYQEAVFFSDYDIDKQIKFRLEVEKAAYLWVQEVETSTLDEKILFLTAQTTGQNRYLAQVRKPIVTDNDKVQLVDRLLTEFTPHEENQVSCRIKFRTPRNYFYAKGLADVVKNGVVYELKFVTELKHEDFLQCACYVVALNLKSGVLWNTRTNEKYEICIPDEGKFLDAVIKTITKGRIKKHSLRTPEKK